MNDVSLTAKLERFQENLGAIERSLEKVTAYLKTSNRDLVSILHIIDKITPK